nr:MAG TPA: hypothetical protein [Caudoviricetes sp.]
MFSSATFYIIIYSIQTFYILGLELAKHRINYIRG